MVKLARMFNSFQPFTVLVIGDFMLDTYTTGRVKRISPEAPVPVMEVLKQESRAGGAGNVALNLAALGGRVIVAGRIGSDHEGDLLKKLLSDVGSRIDSLLTEPTYKTPVKNRLIADSQQLIRIDFEKISPLKKELEDEIIHRLPEFIKQVQIVALSDYGKGFLTDRVIQAVIEVASRFNVPVIVDPKGDDFTKYKGATIIKPNLSEAYAASKMAGTSSLDEVASQILAISCAKYVMITRSEAGISLFNADGERNDFPVRSKEVKDVTGAGDTVLSVICLALANRIDIHQAVQLANIAAGLAIERLGCVQISLSELATRLLKVDSDTKIFDENHTDALHQVLKDNCYSLLILEKGQTMTNSLFRTLRQFEREGKELIIYVRDSHPDDEFIRLLSSLHEVDYIILRIESLKKLCTAIEPHEIYLLEKEESLFADKAKELLNSLLNSIVV